MGKIYKNSNRFSNWAVFLLLGAFVAFYDITWLFSAIQVFFIFVLGLKFIYTNGKFNTYTIWSGVFLLWCFSSLLWTVDKDQSFFILKSVIQIVLFCNLLIDYIKTERELHNVFKYFILASIILTIRLIVQDGNWFTDRIGSSLGYNPNGIGFSMALAALCSFEIAKMKKRKLALLYYIIGSSFSIIAVITGSRKAFMIIAICIPLYFLLKIKNRTKLILIIPITLLVIVLMFQVSLNIPILYNIYGYRLEKLLFAINGLGVADTSTLLRINLIRRGIELFVNKPVHGYGLGTYVIIGGYNLVSHNNIVELLVGVGLIGLILYYIIYIKLINYYFKRWLNKADDVSLYLSIIFTIVVLEFGIISYNMELAQIFIALCYAKMQINKKNVMSNSINKQFRGR